jgi:hypothetical protein
MRREASEPVMLRVTSAFLLEGAVVRKGSIVAVAEDEAKDLLRRGKVELATIEDATVPHSTAHLTAADDGPVEESKPAAPGELDKHTKAELLEMAKELGVDVKASDTKAQVIAALESAVK